MSTTAIASSSPSSQARAPEYARPKIAPQTVAKPLFKPPMSPPPNAVSSNQHHSTIDVSSHAPPTTFTRTSWWTAFRGPGRRGELQLRCFFLTFVAYASTFLLLRPLGLIKHNIDEELEISLPKLGWLDVAALLPLAFCEIFFSSFGDRTEPRIVISTSLVVSGGVMFLFFISKSYVYYLILLAIAGVTQALVFPFCVKALSLAYTVGYRSTIFGVWGCCVFVGGLLGHVTGNLCRSILGWRFVYLLPSIIVAGLGALVHFFLLLPSGAELQRTFSRSRQAGKDQPHKVLMSTETFMQTDKPAASYEKPAEIFVIQSVPVSRDLSIRELASMHMLKEISFAYFCINLLRYALYMWLPIFLHRELDHSSTNSGWISLAFEVGCLIGSPFLGLVTDRYAAGKKLFACQVSLVVSATALLLFYVTHTWGVFFKLLFLFIAGAGNGGPDLILSGTTAVELGEKENCVSSVAGFINGFGILGAVAQSPVLALSAHFSGRNAVFYVFLLIAILPIAALIRARKVDAKLKTVTPKDKSVDATKKSVKPAPTRSAPPLKPPLSIKPSPMKGDSSHIL